MSKRMWEQRYPRQREDLRGLVLSHYQCVENEDSGPETRQRRVSRVPNGRDESD